MTRLLTFHLPPTPDAAATRSLPDTDSDTFAGIIENTGKTQDLCLFPRLRTPKNTNRVIFVPLSCKWHSHGVLICRATETRYKSPCQTSLPSFILYHHYPRPTAFPDDSTPKGPCNRPRAINHVVLCLLVVKDNWISIHNVFYTRSVL